MTENLNCRFWHRRLVINNTMAHLVIHKGGWAISRFTASFGQGRISEAFIERFDVKRFQVVGVSRRQMSQSETLADGQQRRLVKRVVTYRLWTRLVRRDATGPPTHQILH